MILEKFAPDPNITDRASDILEDDDKCGRLALASSPPWPELLHCEVKLSAHFLPTNNDSSGGDAAQMPIYKSASYSNGYASCRINMFLLVNNFPISMLLYLSENADQDELFHVCNECNMEGPRFSGKKRNFSSQSRSN